MYSFTIRPLYPWGKTLIFRLPTKYFVLNCIIKASFSSVSFAAFDSVTRRVVWKGTTEFWGVLGGVLGLVTT